MNTLSYGMPRLSRVKVLIVTMAATLTLALAAQAVTASPASAQRSRGAEYCMTLYNWYVHSLDIENYSQADWYLTRFNENNCGGVITGL